MKIPGAYGGHETVIKWHTFN